MFDPDKVRLPVGSFVAGRLYQPAGEPIEVRRPSDGKVTAIFNEAGAAGVDEAVGAARRAMRESGWRQREPRERGAVLRRWAELVAADGEALAELESVSSSRPIAETRVRDIAIAAELIRFYGECADKEKGEVLASREDVLSLVLREPWGVVAAISPWNVPLVLAAAKVAPAIAAGNAVVLKPSELTPFSALRLAELAIAAGVPSGLFNVVVGTGRETGAALVRHPGVDYVTFTGSTATGAAIMVEAARHGLKPVSLELGGKSPQLVLADADLDRVADAVASGLTRNSGQLCYCGSRLVVDRRVGEPLIGKVIERIRKAVPGPTWDERTTLPPVISPRQLERIGDIVARARAGGARVLCGGSANGEGLPFFEPTLVEARADSPVVGEEVFGPVLAVQQFDEFEEGLRLADHPVYGLAAGIHTRDIDKALKAARAVEAGMVWVNSYGRTLDISSPFGGFKRSGFGKDFGAAAYDKYLRSKSVWIQTH
jgi:aldehyde dehydrogenase (NAD+)